jgi:hypothetical protein
MKILRSIPLIAFLSVASCTAVNEFSQQAITYNLAAERTQNQTLLLNVVRSSLRRPMQFTTVQSVTGTASESGTVQLTLPFGNRTPLSPNSVQLTGTASGGPSFAVAVLDTQEFYQGITRPINARLVDFLLNEGYPSSLVFYLLTNQIDLVGPKGPIRRTRNYVSDDYEFGEFRKIMDFLLRLGLRTKALTVETNYGPNLTHAEAAKMVVAAPNAALGLVRIAGNDTYQVKKSETQYSLCFSPLPAFAPLVNPASLCSDEKAAVPTERYHLQLSTRGILELSQELTPLWSPDNLPVTIELYPRSVEAILYFLGEIVRRHLSPDIPGMTPRVIQIKIGPASQPMPASDCGESDDGISKPLPGNYHCESLFFVERGGNGSADLAVTYHNDIYWLHDERPKTGWSLPTLSLVRELLALNTSAKELPATTTLSIVAP